jgi:long-subunit acyl-CoA synthetase (AMP-forming)
MSILAFLAENYSDSDIVIRASNTDYYASDIQLRCQALSETLNANSIKCFALYGSNSIDWIVADLVSQDMGVTVLPLPTFFSSKQIDFALAKCPIDALLVDSPDSLSPLIERHGNYSGSIANSNLHFIKTSAKASSSDLPANTGKITFTSGSTGQPKGVCQSHQQQIAQAQRLATAVGIGKPKHLCVIPLSTLLENIAGVYAPLLARGQIVVPTQFELGFSGSSLIDPQKFLGVIATVQPDILVPQLLSFQLVAVSQGWQPPTSLKFIAIGGGKVAPDLLISAAKLGLPIYEGYGLSECGSVVSLNTMNSNQVGSCGKPLTNIDLSFHNGEVWVSGNSMLATPAAGIKNRLAPAI